MPDPSVYQTPEDYLALMIDRLQAAGSKLTDFHTGSRLRCLFEGYAAAASQQSAVLEQLRLDSYLATASGDALDRKAADYQVERVDGVEATGSITIERATTTEAVTIPAGWGTLLTAPQPGQQPVAVVTTGDATFAVGVAAATVPAAAVEIGTTGNLPSGTSVIPTNGVNGFDSMTGFTVATAFAGGLDVESDDALRARVPLEVQGRVKGRSEAFLAAALRIPGVTSANVLEAGTTIGTGPGTVGGGHVSLYFNGDPSLLNEVQASCAAARVAGQSIDCFAATQVSTIFTATVYCLDGVDTAALDAAVTATVTALIAATPVGGTVHASAIAQAIHALPDVVSVGIPFAQLRRSTEGSGTAHDVVLSNIEAANPTVTITVATLS